MDLSIIILNYRQAGLVKQCIRGIVMAQPKLRYELIVVDNQSHDDCLGQVAELLQPARVATWFPNQPTPVIPPWIGVQAERNGGFAYGNNLGIKAAQGDYVLVVNPDIAIDPGVLETLIDWLRQRPTVGMVAPQLRYPDGSIQDSCRRFPRWMVPILRRTPLGHLPIAQHFLQQYLMRDFDHASARPVDWLFGAFLLMRRSALDQVGLFDEKFFLYFEDLDLCRRFWQVGWSVWYYPTVSIVHYHQRESAQHHGLGGIFTKAGRIHIASGVRYFRKYWRQSLPITKGLEE